MNFDLAFEKLIGHEGGYVNNPADPGGETRYGISKRSYPNEDIRSMTLERAKAIYKRDYWLPSGGEIWPDVIKYDMFDAAVNSGIIQADKWLQQAAGVISDGKVGPKTMAAVEAANPDILHAKFNGYRLQFMTDLGTWDRFGKGWARRIAGNLINA